MRKDNIFRDIWKLLHSMKFGIILLIIIGISSIAGTLIPQDNIIGFYESTYSPMVFKIIKTFSLHKVYSSWWFIVMILTLSMNLTFCSVKRLPKIIKQIKRKSSIEELRKSNSVFKRQVSEEIDIHKIFEKSKFKNIEVIENLDGQVYFSKKNFIGYIGSWITHLALLIIILAYVYGKLAGFESFVYGVPGSIQEIEGTDYFVEIKDFDIEFREDHTVEQYISDIKVTKKDGTYSEEGDVRVNHPFRGEKINIYQNGTGWALDVHLKKDGKDFNSKTLYQSEVFVEDNKNIALQFVKFYPDFYGSDGHFHTLSPYLNNPKLLYSIFYEGNRVAMNVASMGDEIVWEEYSFKIDNPQMFTLLQIGQDPGMGLAAFGGILLLLGIILAFYMQPKELMVFRYNDGRTSIWANSPKNQEIFSGEIHIILEGILKEEI